MVNLQVLAKERRMALDVIVFLAFWSSFAYAGYRNLKDRGRYLMVIMQQKSTLQMALCAIMWSSAGILIKLVPWNAMVIAGIRSLICAGVFALYMAVARRRFVISAATLRLALTVPATCLCFMLANKMTSAANAIVLQYTAPVFLLLYSYLFQKQRFRGGDYLAVLCTMVGVGLFFLDQLSGGAIYGNLLAIAAGACFAGTMYCTATVDEDARLSGLMQGHLLTALIGLPFLLVYDTAFTPSAMLAVLILGVFQLGIPYILYGLAASGCTPLALTLLAALEPILNPIWVFLFVGEAPGRTALIGGAVVLVSVSLWCIWDARLKSGAAAQHESATTGVAR